MNDLVSKLRSPRFAALGLPALAITGAMLSLRADPQAQTSLGAVANDVTFTRDVAPIMQRSCDGCHRPDSMAPMSLLTYEDARPWARAIKQKVASREMPPWYIDRTVGIHKFKDDPSLTDGEVATIVRWVDGGAVRGNPGDMPKPRQFDDADVWHIGKPDLIVKSVPHVVPAAASDWWGDYVVDSGLTEDRYLKAVETRPSARQITHHALTFVIQEEGESGLLGSGVGAGFSEASGFLNEFAVGKNGDVFPDGTARLVKAGAKIRFNMHYHSIGQEKIDQTEVGLVFYPKGYTPKYYIHASHTGDVEDLDIPAGADNVRSDGYTRLTKNARVTSFQPHMHNRGKAMCMEAIYPDGRIEPISCVNNYKFGWHIVYNYADEAQPLLPAGTMLHVIGWHDNSAGNRYNPDPRNWVGFGQRTIDDMSFAWVNYIWLTEEDFKQQVADRKAAQPRSVVTSAQR